MAAELTQLGTSINAFNEGNTPSSLETAESQAQALVIPEERLLLPLAPGITIDPKGCVDRDDAIFVKKLEDGIYEARITVASVGEFIPEHSPLDVLIQEKGSTIYKKGKVVDPMLPPELSQGILSLLAGQLRPTLTITVLLDKAGHMTDIDVARTCFKSPENYSHEDALTILRDPHHKYNTMLTEAAELTSVLLAARTGRQQRKDKTIGIHTVHEIIEEMMILANQAIATYAIAHDLPVIFRNYPDGYEDCPTELRRGGAYYSVVNRGHRALYVEGYNRGTSSLRRADDVHNTRILASYLAGKELVFSALSVAEVADRLTRKERRKVN